MSTTENTGSSKKCSSQGLVFVLLLFIGFVAGLVTGFMTRDVVMLHIEQMIHAAIGKDDVKLIPAVSKSAVPPGVTEVLPPIAVPTPDDKKKEEEKKAETKPADEAKPAE